MHTGELRRARMRQDLTRCRVFCRLLLKILRISSSLSLDSAGKMRSEVEDLGWMFLNNRPQIRSLFDSTRPCWGTAQGWVAKVPCLQYGFKDLKPSLTS